MPELLLKHQLNCSYLNKKIFGFHHLSDQDILSGSLQRG